jgi:hypothetical protein
VAEWLTSWSFPKLRVGIRPRDPRGIEVGKSKRRIANQPSCTTPLIESIINPFASSIILTAETHFGWVVLGELHAAPALGEQSDAFFFSNFFTEVQCHFTWDRLTFLLCIYFQNLTPPSKKAWRLSLSDVERSLPADASLRCSFVFLTLSQGKQYQPSR